MYECVDFQTSMIGPLRLSNILHVPRWLEVDSDKAEASLKKYTEKKEEYAIYPSKFYLQVRESLKVQIKLDQRDSSLFFPLWSSSQEAS